MFKITDRPTFRRTVTAHVPDGDGVRKETMLATFRAMPSSEVNAFDLNTADGTIKFLTAVIVTVDDLENDAGKVAYTEARERLLDLPWARFALASTYFEEVGKAREGN